MAQALVEAGAKASLRTAWRSWAAWVRACSISASSARQVVISALLRTSHMDLAPDINAAVGKADLLANLRIDTPSGRHNTGRDELGADVSFAEVFFVHTASLYRS